MITGDDLELTRRQYELYTHLVDVWAVIRDDDQDDIKARIAIDIPCYYDYTLNVDDLMEGGRAKRFSLFTTDVLYLPVSVDVANGSWCVNRTPDNKNQNQVHKFMGAPRNVPGTPRRPVNAQIIEIEQDETAPLDLLNFYGQGG